MAVYNNPGNLISNRRAVVPCERAVRSASFASSLVKASGETDAQTASTRDSVGDNIILPGIMQEVEMVELP